MNKNRLLVALLAMLALFFAGCNSDDEEEVIKEDDPGKVEELFCKLLNNTDIDRNGGTFYWAVKTNKAWMLDADWLDDWLTIEPLKGKAGTTGITLVVKALPNEQERITELPFMLGDEEIKINVKQTPEGGEEEEAEGLVCRFIDPKIFSKEGGSLSCILETSADWTLSEEVDWLTVSPTEGKAGQTTLTLTAEPTEILRVAVLTFTLEGRTVELVVCQDLSVPVEWVSPDFYWFEKNPPVFIGYVEPVNEIQPSECGFAYKEKGAGDDTWTFVSVDLEIDEYGGYYMKENIDLGNEKSYIVKLYAKLKETVFFSEEAVEVN